MVKRRPAYDPPKEEKRSIIRTEWVYTFGRSIVEALQRTFQRQDIMASCMTCRNFEWPINGDQREYNCRKYGKPPIDVVINSCVVGYEDNDDIPF